MARTSRTGGTGMKVAIYTRVSGKSNRQDAANQSLQLIEYCQRQGWDYIEYTDRMTGTRADRRAFVQMQVFERLERALPVGRSTASKEHHVKALRGCTAAVEELHRAIPRLDRHV